MKLGIMQPYLFPYIGYFQLIKAVDKYVIYDDVNYIIDENTGECLTIHVEDRS